MLPSQAERGRGCTQQLPGMHIPLCYPYWHTHIYLWNYIYLSWLAPRLQRGELTSRSTITLQGYFHRSLGLSFIISCTHRIRSPAVGHLDPKGARKHQLDDPWTQHPFLRVLPTHPAQLCPRSKRDAVNNSLGWAQSLGFSSPKPGFTTRDGELHLCTPTAEPGDAFAKTSHS